MVCDAHLHSSHLPLADISSGGLFLSCSSSSADWAPLLNDPRIIPFLGIHPECLKDDWELELEELDRILKENPAAGLGECGLDRRFYKLISREEQERALKAHFDLAKKYSRSIVLHQVQASGALADFISGEKPEIPVLIHGFSGSREILKRYIQLDLFISLGPGVHSGGVELAETLKLIPDNRLLLETDWPYTAGRGSTSYKEILNQHYEEISRAMGVDFKTLAWRIRENGAVFTN